MLGSQVCTRASLTSSELTAWSDRLRPMWDPAGTDSRPRMLHRKMWEWLFIAEALSERGMLRPSKRGLGFGVGREPLVSLFAGLGADILATDLDPERAQETGWTESGTEYSWGLDGLNDHGLCPPEEFASRVRFRNVDMNAIPEDIGKFDFTWSSCAFEHLGSIQAGADFVVAQMDCVAPGGVALHTTEMNVSSDIDTIESGATVLFRTRDLIELVERLRTRGCVVDYDFSVGDTPEDTHVDVPPFSDVHLRTTLGEFVTTSVALVIERPG